MGESGFRMRGLRPPVPNRLANERAGYDGRKTPQVSMYEDTGSSYGGSGNVVDYGTMERMDTKSNEIDGIIQWMKDLERRMEMMQKKHAAEIDTLESRLRMMDGQSRHGMGPESPAPEQSRVVGQMQGRIGEMEKKVDSFMILMRWYNDNKAAFESSAPQFEDLRADVMDIRNMIESQHEEGLARDQASVKLKDTLFQEIVRLGKIAELFDERLQGTKSNLDTRLQDMQQKYAVNSKVIDALRHETHEDRENHENWVKEIKQHMERLRIEITSQQIRLQALAEDNEEDKKHRNNAIVDMKEMIQEVDGKCDEEFRRISERFSEMTHVQAAVTRDLQQESRGQIAEVFKRMNQNFESEAKNHARVMKDLEERVIARQTVNAQQIEEIRQRVTSQLENMVAELHDEASKREVAFKRLNGIFTDIAELKEMGARQADFEGITTRLADLQEIVRAEVRSRMRHETKAREHVENTSQRLAMEIEQTRNAVQTAISSLGMKVADMENSTDAQLEKTTQRIANRVLEKSTERMGEMLDAFDKVNALESIVDERIAYAQEEWGRSLDILQENENTIANDISALNDQLEMMKSFIVQQIQELMQANGVGETVSQIEQPSAYDNENQEGMVEHSEEAHRDPGDDADDENNEAQQIVGVVSTSIIDDYQNSEPVLSPTDEQLVTNFASEPVDEHGEQSGVHDWQTPSADPLEETVPEMLEESALEVDESMHNFMEETAHYEADIDESQLHTIDDVAEVSNISANGADPVEPLGVTILSPVEEPPESKTPENVEISSPNANDDRTQSAQTLKGDSVIKSARSANGVSRTPRDDEPSEMDFFNPKESGDGMKSARSTQNSTTASRTPRDYNGEEVMRSARSTRTPRENQEAMKSARSAYSVRDHEDTVQSARSSYTPRENQEVMMSARSAYSQRNNEEVVHSARSMRSSQENQEAMRSARSNHSSRANEEVLHSARSSRTPRENQDSMKSARSNHSPRANEEVLHSARSSRTPRENQDTMKSARSNHSPRANEEVLHSARSSRTPRENQDTMKSARSNHSPRANEEVLHSARSSRTPRENQESMKSARSNHSPKVNEEVLHSARSSRSQRETQESLHSARSTRTPRENQDAMKSARSTRSPRASEDVVHSARSTRSLRENPEEVLMSARSSTHSPRDADRALNSSRTRPESARQAANEEHISELHEDDEFELGDDALELTKLTEGAATLDDNEVTVIPGLVTLDNEEEFALPQGLHTTDD